MIVYFSASELTRIDGDEVVTLVPYRNNILNLISVSQSQLDKILLVAVIRRTMSEN